MTELNSLPEVADVFALAGGTNLALRFGHRLSVDLDFFCPQPFNKSSLSKVLFEKYGAALVLLNETAQSLRYALRGVKTEFLLHEYPTLHVHEDLQRAKLYSIPDVAAMKINAVIGRGAKKDFWDVACLLQQFSLTALIDFYNRKYPPADAGLIIRSLSYFEDAEREPDPISLNKVSWKGIRETIEDAITALV